VNMLVTFRAHPKVTVQTAQVAFIASNSATFDSFFSVLTQNANQWAADGWGGYISFGSTDPNLIGMILFNTKLTLDEAEKSVAPILTFAHSSANLLLQSSVTTSDSFYQAYQEYIAPNEDKVGISRTLSSRLIPKSVLATKVILIPFQHFQTDVCLVWSRCRCFCTCKSRSSFGISDESNRKRPQISGVLSTARNPTSSAIFV
jgi:hypothetical protein